MRLGISVPGWRRTYRLDRPTSARPPRNRNRQRKMRLHGSAMVGLAKPVDMMDRPVTVADREAIGGGDRRAGPALALGTAGFHVLSPSQGPLRWPRRPARPTARPPRRGSGLPSPQKSGTAAQGG